MLLQRITILICCLLMASSTCDAQKGISKKYPSLFWEITGNGLKKPSYLFGTMHVSNKMAFHLSDSFYNAISNTDAVALELNPELWQGQMVSVDQMKRNYSNFVEPPTGDYLNESSFRIGLYHNELKVALSSEPANVNSLLYRSFKAKEDFEEDTFLDLYIFQTGKKLGKRATGVENYFETEKLILEAYADMANEKKKRTNDDDESVSAMTDRIKDAYKNGDLDLLDSLDNAMEKSAAFREKFLFRRNEIQASSIDSIIKKSSLFVGIGAAHLPGKRGVIELLKKLGYQLRPIKMINRDARRRETIDKIRVPVAFTTTNSDDGFFQVSLPGTMYKMTDNLQQLNRMQYADMANGSYYQVTRIKTHSALLNQSVQVVKKVIDSLLYENVPGKIIKKIGINKFGYTGYDIVNKTRRGDLQRSQLFITPFEILIFKISGKENYAVSEESSKYFASIKLQPLVNKVIYFTPDEGGFAATLPQPPSVYCNTFTTDGIKRWEYEAVDSASGNTYVIFKKSVHNLRFLEEDSFEVKLMEQSVQSSEFIERQLARKFFNWKGYPCLQVKEKMKDSSIITARYIINAVHYYAVMVKSNTDATISDSFFNSFELTDFKYPAPTLFTDTFYHFKVATPVLPLVNIDYRSTIEKVTAEIGKSARNKNYNNYWPKSKNASFKNDVTGEYIGVSVQQYPLYYYVYDNKGFWKKEIEDRFDEKDMLLYKKEAIMKDAIISGYTFELRDTGSSKSIKRMLLLKDDCMYSVYSISDTISGKHSFIDVFYDSFKPLKRDGSRNVFDNYLDTFFAHLFSEDSTIKTTARQAINNVYFGEKGVPGLLQAIGKLNDSEKNYMETKSKLIAELGFIKDTSNPVVVNHLKNIYWQSTDTSMFQNEIIEALARHKTNASFNLLKELVLQDPPVFDNTYEYSNLLELIKDSLPLAASLFPDLLQLTLLDDYKVPVTALLVTLVDSGYIKGDQYKTYLNKFYFDAKIMLKKQAGKESKILAEEKNTEDEDPYVPIGNSIYKDELKGYSILLAPFYFDNKNIQIFLNKLLNSSNKDILLNTSMVMLKNKLPIADSFIEKLAANNESRSRLYQQLQKINRLDKFPLQYKTQLEIAKSLLYEAAQVNTIDSLEFVDTTNVMVAGKKGLVYLFKYKLKNEKSWKMAVSGLQPQDDIQINCNVDLNNFTNKKIVEDKPLMEQFDVQLKKLLFGLHKSAKKYFEDDVPNYRTIHYN